MNLKPTFNLINIFPLLNKVNRIDHSIRISYDINNSDTDSAWQDVCSEISNSYNFLTNTVPYDDNNSQLKPEKMIIEIGKKISIDDISILINGL
jgi:hypothetical protein